QQRVAAVDPVAVAVLRLDVVVQRRAQPGQVPPIDGGRVAVDDVRDGHPVHQRFRYRVLAAHGRLLGSVLGQGDRALGAGACRLPRVRNLVVGYVRRPATDVDVALVVEAEQR